MRRGTRIRRACSTWHMHRRVGGRHACFAIGRRRGIMRGSRTESLRMDEQIVVIGAGAAGLAAAAVLRGRGLDPLVLEQDAAIGGTWARRYDRLHLHTVRDHSGLPGYPIPREHGRYLSRDAYAAYLQDYAHHHGLRLRTRTPVSALRL